MSKGKHAACRGCANVVQMLHQVFGKITHPGTHGRPLAVSGLIVPDFEAELAGACSVSRPTSAMSIAGSLSCLKLWPAGFSASACKLAGIPGLSGSNHH